MLLFFSGTRRYKDNIRYVRVLTQISSFPSIYMHTQKEKKKNRLRYNYELYLKNKPAINKLF